MNRVRVKICGLTRVEDLEVALACGVDALGFVFAQSPRKISTDVAARLLSHVPAGVLRVGLFLDQPKSEIESVLSCVSLDLLQFHGAESEQLCKSFGLPYLKAVSMQDGQSAQQAENDYPTASGLLLDSHVAGGQGGSGKAFDWDLVRPVRKPVWLAGGLNAANVERAISMVRPYAVDVSSGVESSPGLKDPDRIRAFVGAVRNLQEKSMKGIE